MEQKKITVDISKAVVYDLDGSVIDIPDLHKDLGNKLYKMADTIPVSDIARAIYNGDAVDAAQEEVEEIINLLDTSIRYKAFVQKPLINYFNELLTSLKNKKDGKNN